LLLTSLLLSCVLVAQVPPAVSPERTEDEKLIEWAKVVLAKREAEQRQAIDEEIRRRLSRLTVYRLLGVEQDSVAGWKAADYLVMEAEELISLVFSTTRGYLVAYELDPLHLERRVLPVLRRNQIPSPELLFPELLRKSLDGRFEREPLSGYSYIHFIEGFERGGPRLFTMRLSQIATDPPAIQFCVTDSVRERRHLAWYGSVPHDSERFAQVGVALREFHSQFSKESIAYERHGKSLYNEPNAEAQELRDVPIRVTLHERQEADTRFSLLCATCHGERGKGDGPGAIALNPKPRDYTDATWQKSVTDEELRKIIVQGGQAVGKSPLMPPNPDLQDKPGVVEALVQKVRSFAR
jgi:hypothetical protein